MRVRLKLDRLIEELGKRNKSQNHWAITLGLSRGHLSELINGKHPFPTAKTREKLVIGLGLAFEDLFELEPDSHEWADASSAAFQAGLYDRYAIDAELGEGGMGRVYLARDIKHGRRVAIKVISPEAVSGVGIKAFLKETRHAAVLQHQHILPLYDSGEVAGYPFFVMPYIAGGSLRDRLEREKVLPVRETIRLVAALAQALECAHDSRVVHCDVKPENVLLSGDHAWLADFGISRVIHGEVQALGRRAGLDASAGTPAYVSPEQAAGEPVIDGRADVYSLACVTFELLAGQPPFQGKNTTEVVAKRFSADPPDVRSRAPHVSESMSVVIQRGMAVDREHRFLSATEFDAALSDAAPGRRSWHAGARRRLLAIRRRLPDLESVAPGTPRWQWLADMSQDAAYAVRGFRRRWAQTLVLLATIALGIGLNSAVFSILNTVVLRPLPYPEPHQLVDVLRESRSGDGASTLSLATVHDIEAGVPGLASVAGYTGARQSVLGGNAPVHAAAYFTTQRFFDVLGIAPVVGTTIPTSDGAAVAIVSHGFWQRVFGADSAVLGRTVSVNGAAMPVAAVMPPGFAFPTDAEVWVQQDLRPIWGLDRRAHGLRLVGRLDAATSIETVGEQLESLARQITATEPSFSDFTFAASPLHDRLAARGRRTLVLLLAMVGMVMLIACANVAGVLSAQAIGRRREMTLRRALGASTGRLVRQTITEATLLGIAGAGVALVANYASLAAINRTVPGDFLHSGAVTLDIPVIAFTLGLGVLAGLLFGLLPALRVAFDERRSGKLNQGRGSGRHGRLGGGLLVVPQYALSLAVLVAAVVLLRGLLVLLAVEPGFETSNLVTAEIDLPVDRYDGSERQETFRRQVLEAVRAAPGVVDAAFEYTPPLVPGANIQVGVHVVSDPDRVASFADWRTVSPEYFRTTAIPVTRGRSFEAGDDVNSPGVVVINETLARLIWPDENPIGRALRPNLLFLSAPNSEPGGWMRVIGVVGDVHHRGLDRDPLPAVYMPAAQHPWEARGMDLVIRTSPTATDMHALVTGVIAGIDPDVPVGQVSTMDSWILESVAAPRFRAALLLAFASIAVALVLLGVYAVVSHSVVQRRRELAVRAALGADRSRLLRLISGDAITFVVVGQVAGTLMAWMVSQWLRGMVFEAPVFDFGIYLGATILLASVVMVSSYVPAVRASRVDPAVALKE